MKARNILIGILFAFAMSASGQSDNNVIDEVIWVVGDEAILRSDVEAVRMDALQSGERWDGDPYCIIPEQLAVQKLFLHQAEIDSVEVTDADVFQSVDEEISREIQSVGSKDKLEEYLGMTTTKRREMLYNVIRDKMMMSEVQKKLVDNVKVTPAQVRRYFKDLPEDSIPFVPTQVECQIITREPLIPQEEIDRVKNELRNYTERVNNGSAQFSTLAMMYSEDKASAMNGGELGFSGRGELVPEFANVAFNLTDPKAVSKIVESEYGFHIIQLIEKRGDLVNCRHILLKPRVTSEALQQSLNEMDSIKSIIDDGTKTFDQLVIQVSYDKDTRANYGLMMNRDLTSKFELKDLPVEVARAVAGMTVGEISKPFIMADSKGRDVVAIVKLKSRTNGHRATMADDYQVLHDVVVEKIKNDKIEQWIREKQKTTYVRINDEWKNCEFKYSGWIK